MAGRVWVSRITLSGVLAALALASQPLAAQQVSAVPVLDQKQIQGTWYEIARLPTKREKTCLRDAVELIAPGNKPGQLLIVDSCKTATEYNTVRNLTAKPQNKHKTGDGAFKIATVYPFTRKYWVLAVDPASQWMLTGSPDHKGLWMLAKTATLSPDVLAGIRDKAAAEGFAVARLMSSPPSKSPTSLP